MDIYRAAAEELQDFTQLCETLVAQTIGGPKERCLYCGVIFDVRRYGSGMADVCKVCEQSLNEEIMSDICWEMAHGMC